MTKISYTYQTGVDGHAASDTTDAAFSYWPTSTMTTGASQKFGKRHVLAFWLFTGFVNIYILRVSINVAIVSMVNDTMQSRVNLNGTCPLPENSGSPDVFEKPGEFNWDHQTRGIILSSFYYGYICTQIIAGFMARKISARFLFGMGIGVTALLTLANPAAARMGPEVLAFVRLVEGIFEGVTFPACYHIFGYWAPKTERTVMIILPLTGAHFGTVISAPLTGWLCDYGFAGGWPSSFYVFGIFGLLWCVGWFLVVYDTPAEHPSISEEERLYIEQYCPNSTRRNRITPTRVPWKEIATSKPVWALVFAHTCFNWGFYYLLTEMASYLRDVLHIGTFLNGIVSSIPYICFFVAAISTAKLSDVIRGRGVSTTIVRKIFFGIGSILSAIFLIVISYIGCNIVAVVTILCFAVGISGVALTGYSANHVDLAPQYASILMGITNTMATLPGILTPLITGAIVNHHSTIATWQTVFVLASLVTIFGAVFFCIFGQGELQPWAKGDMADTNDNQSCLIKASNDDVAGESVSYH